MILSGDKTQQTSAKPFVKWLGGKRQLISELDSRLPENLDVYFEPFLGGGALFFHLAHRINQAYLSDINQELILSYKAIQNEPNRLIRELSKHKNTEEHFQEIRDVDRNSDYEWNWTPLQKAARFIYLNKTCFNGLYRVNSQGHFNVPFGHYENPKIVDEENIYACNSVLCRPGVFLDCKNYSSILREVRSLVSLQKKVFVYLDPPYIPISISSSFTQYSKDGFTMADQKSLKEFCYSLTDLGVFWMQSNSSAPVVFEMYKEFNIDTISVRRSVSAASSSRKQITETIIRNYK